jgi:hypothetical protein
LCGFTPFETTYCLSETLTGLALRAFVDLLEDAPQHVKAAHLRALSISIATHLAQHLPDASLEYALKSIVSLRESGRDVVVMQPHEDAHTRAAASVAGVLIVGLGDPESYAGIEPDLVLSCERPRFAVEAYESGLFHKALAESKRAAAPIVELMRLRAERGQC